MTTRSRSRDRVANLKFQKQLLPGTCSMVAALNAAIYWGFKVPTQRSREWKRLVKLAGADIGNAVRADLVRERLGISSLQLVPRIWAIKDALRQGIPVEVEILQPWRGSPNRKSLHAVLVVPSDPQLVLGWRPGKAAYRIPLKKVVSYMPDYDNPNRRARALIPAFVR